MENRETIIIKTPISNAEVVLKSWITGREKREINNVLFKDVEFEGQSYRIGGEKLAQLKDKTIEIVVVSINGVTENVLDILLDMRSEDYDYVLSKVDEITSDRASEELKKK
ncbi:MAG: hypothetical protein M0R03_14975 [Novosphingobium sp.]|nr:hypothetical protein [Novosphingobium sp.]